MKMFKKTALAVALTAAAGMANAGSSTIDITESVALTTEAAFDIDTDGDDTVGQIDTNDTGAISVEQRVVSAGAINLVLGNESDGLDRSIVYKPAVALATGLTLTFEVTGGELAANNGLALIAYNDSGVPAYVQVGSVNDFVAGANGWTSVVMQLDLTDANSAGADGVPASFLNADGQIADGTALALVDLANSVNPNFVMDQDADALSIAMTKATNTSGVILNAPVAAAEDVAVAVSGLALDVNTITSVIDVEYVDGSREGFLAGSHELEAAAPTATAPGDLTPVTAPITSIAGGILDLGSPEVTIDVADVTSASYSLTRSNIEGVDTVTLAGVAATLTDGVYTSDLGKNISNLTVAHDLNISVLGTDVLATGNWDLSLTVDPNGLVNATFVDIASEVAPFTLTDQSHKWDINGAQFKLPYHAQNVSGFNFFFNAVNETDIDAEVFADLIVQNKTQGTSVTVNNVLLGTAAANSSTTFGQAGIKTAVNAAAAGTINDADVYHVAMTLTAVAPEDSVHVAAFQKDALGRTVVPVLVSRDIWTQ